MELMALPKVHPLSFRHRIQSLFNPVIDRNFIMGHDPFITYRPKPVKKAVNILTKGETYEIRIPLPAYKKENIAINLNGNVLTVYGHREQSYPGSSKFVTKEFGNEYFRRSFRLGTLTDQDEIRAHFQKGILSISLHSKSHSPRLFQPRNIAVA